MFYVYISTTNNQWMMTETSVNQEKPKKQRKARTLPALTVNAGADEMTAVSYTGKVDPTPVSWDALPLYSLFSTSADGSYPMVKTAKTQYADLRTQRSYWCGSGRCYRVLL